MAPAGCKLGLEETGDSVVVSFGSSLWHVDCRCAKCHNLVEHDTNLLLLSDGSPVCENCSYICSVCQKPIVNEAIVTGDESYHADCFRCRSCSNKIEELIFAKTSQGIWCMACHNERVARSRKHAEAKRSRSNRKEKEKDKLARSHAGTPNTDIRSSSSTGQVVSAGSSTALGAHSGGETLNSGSPAVVSGAHGSSSGSTSATLNVYSSPSLAAVDPRPLPPSPQPGNTGDVSARSSPSGVRSRHLASESVASVTSVLAVPTLATPPSDVGLSTKVLNANGSGADEEDDNDHADDDERSDSAGRLSPAILPGSRQGSLSAPHTDRSANRRSGFYGAMRRPSAEDDGNASGVVEDLEIGIPLVAAAAIGRGADQEGEGDVEDLADDPPDAPSSTNPSFLPELHHSMSFYDPDTLLFLNHVGTETLANGAAAGVVTPEATDHEVEHLSPDLGEGVSAAGVDGSSPASSGDDDLPRERNPKSEVARKLRESIRRSREGSSGGAGMNLDIEMVETLLAELESTKRDMQGLQAKYNAFRRASRSAFEGFSMARDEYDKEVAARREAESAMAVLRIKFAEQALKLAAVDKEHRATEALKGRSKELRLSVVGMEKQLTQLKAEVEISTAQVEELQSATDESSTTSPSELEHSLTARLEAIKASHRRELEALIQQRDELVQEITELRQTRDMYTEETAELNVRNTSLADKNAEATRQLDETLETAAKLRSPMLSPTLEQRSGHYHSSSSVSVPLLPARPSLSSSSRTALAAPTPPSSISALDSDLTSFEFSHRIAKQELVEHHVPVVKKFKWGKAKIEKNELPRPSHPTALPSTANKPFPPPRPTASTDSSARAHVFQQISILRPVRCEYCSDKMWGLNEVRCTSCGCYAHAKCAGYLHGCGTPSVHQQDDTLTMTHSGPAMFGNDLTAQARIEDRQVPVVVVKCIAAVEAHGMNYEGIYRKTGGSSQTKEITACFERGENVDLLDINRFNDLAAITSCMKNFFRSLPDPLFTHDLHEEFVHCAELPEGDGRLSELETTLYRLPEVHFHTARKLLDHLHHIHLQSGENKMTPANLGVVFGPTVLRSRERNREFSDMGFKAKVVEIMVEHYPRLFVKPYPGED